MTVQQQSQTIYTWTCDQTKVTQQGTTPAVPLGWAHITIRTSTLDYEFDLSPAAAAPFLAALNAAEAAGVPAGVPARTV